MVILGRITWRDSLKTEKEIKDMYSFVGGFNDGAFMNQEYRRGIMDALSFVLYQAYGPLEQAQKYVEEIVIQKYKINKALDDVKFGRTMSTKDLKKKMSRLIDV
jgi:hypothetical protein